MSTKPFPLLPDDIERFIFELLAREDCKIALQLVTLAKHIRPWIEPEIYRRITLSGKQPAQFVWTIRNSGKPASWFHDHVKALWLPDPDPHQTLILSVCTGLNVLGAHFLKEHQITEKLRQLSIGMIRPLSLPLSGKIHHSLTHLGIELCDTLDSLDVTVLSCLPCLQYLHLSDGSSGFLFQNNLPSVSEFLASEVFNSPTAHLSPTVRAIVLGYGYCPGQNEPMADERVIIATWEGAVRHRWVLDECHVIHPWGYITPVNKCRPTIWEQAEAILQDRREYYAKNHSEQQFLMYPQT